MVLRKPFTLISDETLVPRSMTSGRGLRQPPKIVSHSSNRCRSDAKVQAFSGDRAEDTDTSTQAMSRFLPHERFGQPRTPQVTGVAPSTLTRSGFIACSCEPQ